MSSKRLTSENTAARLMTTGGPPEVRWSRESDLRSNIRVVISWKIGSKGDSFRKECLQTLWSRLDAGGIGHGSVTVGIVESSDSSGRGNMVLGFSKKHVAATSIL